MSRVLYKAENQITCGYKKGSHNGVDVVKKWNKTCYIISHSDGEVIQAVKGIPHELGATGLRSYGNYVKIKHDNGYYTLYGHIAYGTVKVNVGDRVSRGQVIGYLGNTGESYGAHLHWEVRDKNDTRIDPTPYLNADLPREVELPQPVERNKNATQLQVIESYLNVRLDHSTSAQSIGFCPVGIYNIVSTYEDGTYNFYKKLELIKPIVQKYDLAYYNQESILGGTSLGLSTYPSFTIPGSVTINALVISGIFSKY